MNEPNWIRLDVVLAIHAAQLAEHGGLDGVRDRDGLESALASPKNLFAYGDPKPDFAALAAQLGEEAWSADVPTAYLNSIIKVLICAYKPIS